MKKLKLNKSDGQTIFRSSSGQYAVGFSVQCF